MLRGAQKEIRSRGGGGPQDHSLRGLVAFEALERGGRTIRGSTDNIQNVIEMSGENLPRDNTGGDNSVLLRVVGQKKRVGPFGGDCCDYRKDARGREDGTVRLLAMNVQEVHGDHTTWREKRMSVGVSTPAVTAWTPMMSPVVTLTGAESKAKAPGVEESVTSDLTAMPLTSTS